MRKKIKVLMMGIGVLFAFVASLILLAWRPWLKPPEVMNRFFSQEVAEEANIDILILAGDRIVPSILESITNRDMPKRRYAIRFLGNGLHKEATLVLEKILADGSEDDFIRSDALIALYRINHELGIELAKKYVSEPSSLGKNADKIMAGDIPDRRRSFWQALLGSRN